jgi:hypothetical protein
MEGSMGPNRNKLVTIPEIYKVFNTNWNKETLKQILPVQLQIYACISEQFSRMCHRPYPEMISMSGLK